MVMEAVEKKPHIEDDASPKAKKEDIKEEQTKEPVAKKRKTTKLDQCKNLLLKTFTLNVDSLLFLKMALLKADEEEENSESEGDDDDDEDEYKPDEEDNSRKRPARQQERRQPARKGAETSVSLLNCYICEDTAYFTFNKTNSTYTSCFLSYSARLGI